MTLAAADNGDVDGTVPILGHRLDCISRRYTRDWEDAGQPDIREEAPVALSGTDLALLEAVDGRRSASEVLSAASNGGGTETLVRLARRGVIDLL